MFGLRRVFQIGFAVSRYLLWCLLVRLHPWRAAVTQRPALEAMLVTPEKARYEENK